ncbi:MAG: glycosyltransferase family 39 protein [Terriglobales bacterium]
MNRLRERTRITPEIIALLGIAGTVALLHLLTNNRYGFHRDEFQVLSDALHLDWGFIPYPPLNPFLTSVGLHIFGLSLVGLRLFSVIATTTAIFVTGLMAYELGGGRLAQITAALAVALSGLSLFEGTEFQYTTYDYLWWVLIAYFVVRLLKTENPRWWLAIGAAAGLGLQSKYAMAFLLCGVLGGVLLTGARRFLGSIWFWIGIGVAFVIFLPNLIWQVRHDFISVHFLHHIHVRDVGEGRADGFFVDQIRVCTNFFAMPLWIAGLVCFLRDRHYRMLGWMYLIPLALFVIGKGRGYYLGAAYASLIAMGAVVGERWAQSLPKMRRCIVEGVFFTGLAAYGALMIAIVIPLANSGPLKAYALKNNGDLREEIGWDDLLKTVAGIRDSLPPEQRASFGIITGNYGEQGAIEILGPAYHLPPPISGTNSAWLRGYPTPPPTTLLVLGLSRGYTEKLFTDCRLAGHYTNHLGIKNEESDSHPDIWLCGPPAKTWPEFWDDFQAFG